MSDDTTWLLVAWWRGDKLRANEGEHYAELQIMKELAGWTKTLRIVAPEKAGPEAEAVEKDLNDIAERRGYKRGWVARSVRCGWRPGG